MRKTETSGWMVPGSPGALRRALRLAVIALGIGVVMTAGVARAQDDEEDEKTFEEKIIEGIMAGIGGTNMENRGIDYRERSPLVVPPKIDLPPPATGSAEVKNWPKDPDEARRKAAIAARKKENKDPREASRVLMPSELAKGKTAAAAGTNNDPIQPGNSLNNRSSALRSSAILAASAVCSAATKPRRHRSRVSRPGSRSRSRPADIRRHRRISPTAPGQRNR